MKKHNKLLIIKYVFLCFSAILVIFPMLFVLLSSFKNNDEIFSSPFNLPTRFLYQNYLSVFNNVFHLHTYFINSLIYAALVCSLGVLINTMAAYAIGRMKWKLSKPVLALFLSGIMIPGHATLVPMYLVVSRFRLPSQVALMLLFLASTIPTSVFLIYGYLSNIPRAVEESAIIDGSTIPQMFFRIVIPMIKPAIATVTIFNFMLVWNDLLLSLVFLTADKYQTLQLGITRFKSAFFTNYGLMLAAIVLSMIPTIIVYLFMSEKIIGGITAGAVKG